MGEIVDWRRRWHSMPSERYGEWAAYARKMLAAASPVAARVIAERDASRELADQARQQVNEAKAANVVYEAAHRERDDQPQQELSGQ